MKLRELVQDGVEHSAPGVAKTLGISPSEALHQLKDLELNGLLVTSCYRSVVKGRARRRFFKLKPPPRPRVDPKWRAIFNDDELKVLII